MLWVKFEGFFCFFVLFRFVFLSFNKLSIYPYLQKWTRCYRIFRSKLQIRYSLRHGLILTIPIPGIIHQLVFIKSYQFGSYLFILRINYPFQCIVLVVSFLFFWNHSYVLYLCSFNFFNRENSSLHSNIQTFDQTIQYPAWYHLNFFPNITFPSFFDRLFFSFVVSKIILSCPRIRL